MRTTRFLCRLTTVLFLLIARPIAAQSQPAKDLTGTYERTQPDYAMLKIIAIGANKIQFHLSSRYQRSEREGDVNTTEAQGVAVIKNNAADYVDGSDGEVHLRFNGNTVQVRASEYYCGLNTTLDGTYRKKQLLSRDSTSSRSSGHAQSQLDMNVDAGKDYAKADAELNKVYKQIVREYQGQKPFLLKLQAAERAWIVFRDAELEAIFPAANKTDAYGSVYPMCRFQWLTQITKQRTSELKRWIRGSEEGDVCCGSIHNKN